MECCAACDCARNRPGKRQCQQRQQPGHSHQWQVRVQFDYNQYYKQASGLGNFWVVCFQWYPGWWQVWTDVDVAGLAASKRL
jgi:hypothetical protein